jgi:protein-disulfide isomerase
VVNRVRVTPTRWPRVYTFWTTGLLALLPIVAGGTGLAGIVVVAGGAGAQAPIESGADPGMIKGPASAPVTIVEFSDYQ